MTEQQRPARSDHAAAAVGPENRRASWSAVFRVAEVRDRSTPQLVTSCGTVLALAVAFPWMTITHARQGGAADWDMGRWLDGLSGIVVFSVLVTLVLAAAEGVFLAYEAIRDGQPVGRWVLGPVVTFTALCVLPLFVPAATGSLARRFSRETGR